MASIAGLFRAGTYRGREGQIAWMLHRVTGVGIFLFLALHILDLAYRTGEGIELKYKPVTITCFQPKPRT